MIENIFEHNYCGQICYSVDTANRISDVKRCRDIDALLAARKQKSLQKTVLLAIDSQIRKLEKG